MCVATSRVPRHANYFDWRSAWIPYDRHDLEAFWSHRLQLVKTGKCVTPLYHLLSLTIVGLCPLSMQLSANVSFSAYINYFNIKNSHWEPLIEPWQFDLQVFKEMQNGQHPLNVKIVSTRDLNVNITHTFLESAMTTIVMFDKQKNVSLELFDSLRRQTLKRLLSLCMA